MPMVCAIARTIHGSNKNMTSVHSNHRMNSHPPPPTPPKKKTTPHHTHNHTTQSIFHLSFFSLSLSFLNIFFTILSRVNLNFDFDIRVVCCYIWLTITQMLDSTPQKVDCVCFGFVVVVVFFLTKSCKSALNQH